MAAKNNLLPDDKYTEIVKGATIYITKKTVQFGSDVYQFHNVTGFGISRIKTGNIFPITWILVLFVLGLIIGNVTGNSSIGIIMVTLAIGGILSNVAQPKRYGLGIYLNSGHEKIFITNDVLGLKKIVAILYEYMDNKEKLGTYVVNIVEGNVTGNFIGGDAHKNNLNFL